MAWDTVCMTKELGGLGVRDIPIQNQCLLLKLIHRLYNPSHSAWAQWVRQQVDPILLRDLEGAQWSSLQALLPSYRVITTVELHNGQSTSFWDDNWAQSGSLAAAYPALLNHCTKRDVSISEIVHHGLQRTLVP